jgi:hypothetical protein
MTPDSGWRSFEFLRDTLTFANELVWRYEFHPVTGTMSVSRSDPPPTYSHRCFVLVRTVRQFFYHARFEPNQPVAPAEAYRDLIRRVVSSNPRRRNAERIVIPGFDCLRTFCQAHESLFKAECGGPWQSYFLRSHWRMVFPVWPRHQERMADQLRERVVHGAVPAVHLFRFPKVTINHGLLLFGMAESEREIQFTAYDPNIPARAVTLIYDRPLRAFRFPAASYWSGGVVSVIEIYRGGLY